MESETASRGAAPTAGEPAEPAAVGMGKPGAPSAAADGRRMHAARIAILVAVAILAAFGAVWAYPALSPLVVIAALAVSAFALWGAARADRAQLAAERDRLAETNRLLTARLEGLADVAWELHESEERYRSLLDAREKAEAASQAKSRVLATVSHEFRTPLNGILGLTGLLAETNLTPDQRTYARAVQSSGEALLALVDDMLDFSKAEAGRLDLRPEATDPAALLEDVAELLAARAYAKGIEIAVEAGIGVPAAIHADPARLRQVLLNLAGNAVKFTDSGGVLLAAEAIDGGRRIRWSVADSGPGIPEDDAERMFDEFEQMDTARSRRHGGAGLGLAISRRIVRAMGGDIAVTPRPGGGSVFSFAVDLIAVDREAEQSTTPEVAGLSILILAPAGPEADATARRLASRGTSARVVGTLAEAAGLVGAAAAAGEAHDAILIDARTSTEPEKALARLREAAGRRLPAAALIEPRQRGEVKRLKAAGYDAYLVRPVRDASLLGIVAAITGDGDKRRFRIDPADARAPAAERPRRAGAGMEVLLAEDNEINALLARAVLEQLGHTVTEVRDGKAAVAAVRARRTPFDAILMDLHMPGLDGLSAAAAVRAFEAEAGMPRTAILALTADVLAETRAAARAAGIDLIVEKPMTPATLRKALGGIAAA